MRRSGPSPLVTQYLVPILILAGVLLAIEGSTTAVKVLQQFEVAELSFVRGWDTTQYQDYFERLAKQKGAVYAYEVLETSRLPEEVDAHEIGHTIGWVLYDEKGIAGMAYCTPSFRNACAHALVISAYIEQGEAALPDIVEACEQAPGGKGAYATCFHGIGHGILAYVDYNYEQAMEKCREVRDLLKLDDSRATPNEVWNRCVEGATMELDLGTHDPQVWEQAKKVYFPETDLYMPCDASYVDPQVRPMCYSYLTWRFLEEAGAVRGAPSPETYPEAMAYCGAIEKPNDRGGCYAGFGKNFIYLATLDERKARTLSDAALTNMTTWCRMAGTSEGEEACMLAILNGMDLANLEGAHTAARFCDVQQEEGGVRDSCFMHLIYNGHYYFGGTGDLATFCEGLPESYRKVCASPADPSYVF